MSSPPRDRAASRAEARRRARLAARGELPEEEDEVSTEAEAPRVGLLGRLFPPAPPLPNKPPPLAGFDESGPLRPIRVRTFLLRRNLAAWVAPGLVAGVGGIATFRFGPEDVLSLVGTFVRFGALIAAGWFGWQRPALYGTAAAILSFLLFVAVLLVSASTVGVTTETLGEAGIVGQLAIEGAFQTALGYLAGWYGGYLRRRQVHVSGERARQTRRR
jgi:hypothetical protein